MKVSKKINLAQLDSELNGQGLNAILNDKGEITEVLLTDNNSATEAELKAAIDAHAAIDTAQAKATAKTELLAKLGITQDEANLLLS